MVAGMMSRESNLYHPKVYYPHVRDRFSSKFGIFIIYHSFIKNIIHNISPNLSKLIVHSVFILSNIRVLAFFCNI